jgi:hypothetical protein
MRRLRIADPRGYIAGMKSRLGAIAVVLVAALSLLSCATSAGSLLAKVQAAEAADEKNPPPPPPPEGTGLEIVTTPDGAEVWINNRYEGTTPLLIQDLAKGTYRLLLAHAGYHETLVWLDYPGGPMRYEVTLDPIVGFVQIDVSPRGAEVTLNGSQLADGITPVPVGFYDVAVRAFGYTEWHGHIEVFENVVTPITVDLEPAVFSISPPSFNRTVVNPDNPGVLGTVAAGFTVTGPGSGAATVFDAGGREVHREELPRFSTWSQRWSWRPTDAVPDGAYTLVVSGLGSDGSESRQESPFTIDRTARIALRSTWSGGSGLLYAPVAESLPEGSFQASLVAIAYSDNSVLQAPVQLSLRAGLGANLELDASAGAILTGATPPIFGSVSLRWVFARSSGPIGFSTALEGKAALQGVPGTGYLTTDTFANFSGLSLGIPMELRVGTLIVLAEPAIITSAWQVDYESAPVWAASPASWMYWRAGLMLDTGSFVVGASASFRSEPLPYGLFVIDLPFQAGVEAHWLIPDTHIIVGAAVAGEFGYPEPWAMYLMGGMSLGMLF